MHGILMLNQLCISGATQDNQLLLYNTDVLRKSYEQV